MPAPFRPADVFRVRRIQPTRLEGFIDASFAFAVTLVVISIGHVPDSVTDLLHSLRGMPTFALCFFLIARIWKSHRDWSQRYDLEDGATIALSLILVFLVLVYVYPLRLLFALMFSGFSDGWLVEQPIGVHSNYDVRAAYVMFGIGYALIWLVFALLYWHALRQRIAIGLDAAEVIATRIQIALMLSYVAIALLSVLLAANMPMTANGENGFEPGLVYLLMTLARPLVRLPYIRRIAALRAPSAS